LALKYGFIRVIFFQANVVRAEKHNRKLPCHLPHVIAGKVANVVESVAHRVVDGLKVKVENANSEENVLCARRENALQGESDQPRSARGPHARHAHKGSVLRARRGNGPLDPGEPKALSRKFQSCRKLRKSLRLRYPQFRMFKRPRYLKLRKSLRLRYPQFRMFKRPRYLKPRHHRHLHRAMALLRASRGDSKPCYWHHHDISTASNIAVV
jgi:hypothetical protein